MHAQGLKDPGLNRPQIKHWSWLQDSESLRELVIGLQLACVCRYVANLSACADCWVFCYPNAGLPNAMGGYDQKGAEMAAEVGAAEVLGPGCSCG